MGNAEPCIFVIFGATGDLMRRKLLPALYRLAADGWMPNTCRILGVARAADMDDSRYRDWVRAALADDGFDDNEAIAKWCTEAVDYQPIGDGTTSDFQALAARLDAIERARQLPGNRVHYLALPPGAFPGTIAALGAAGLASSPA